MYLHSNSHESSFPFIWKNIFSPRILAIVLFSIVTINTGHTTTLKSANQSNAASLQDLSTNIAIDGFGFTYYIDTSHNIIYRYTHTGATTQINCCTGLSPSTLNNPRSIAVDSHGDLYIADTENNRVVEVADVTSSAQVSLVDTQALQLSSPSGVSLDAGGDLYISDTGNNRLIKVDVARQASIVNTAPYQLASPLGVSVDPSGLLYIADAGNNRILAVPPSGSPTVLFSDQVNAPMSITPDGYGNLYIAQTGGAAQQNADVPGEVPAVVASFSSTSINLLHGTGEQAPVTTLTITLTPHGGFNQTLSLGVAGMPVGTFGDLTPPVITFDGNTPVVETFEIGIPEVGQYLQLTKDNNHPKLPNQPQRRTALAAIAPLSLLLFIGFRTTHKNILGLAKITGIIAIFVLLPAVAMMTSGCKAGFPNDLNSNKTYTATLVARAQNGNAIYPLGSFGITMP